MESRILATRGAAGVAGVFRGWSDPAFMAEFTKAVEAQEAERILAEGSNIWQELGLPAQEAL